jgi:hypothetical protein
VPFGTLLDEWPQLTEKPATEDNFRKPLHQRDGNCKRTAAEEWSEQQQQLRNIAAVGDCAGQHPAYSVRLHAEKEQAAGDCHRQLLQKVTAPDGSEEVDQTPAFEEVYMQQQLSAAGLRSLAQGQQTSATEFSSVEEKQQMISERWQQFRQTMPRQSSSLNVKERSAVRSLFNQQPEGSCQLVKQNISIR